MNSPLTVDKESLNRIKLTYNDQYTIEIGQCTDNLIIILYSESNEKKLIMSTITSGSTTGRINQHSNIIPQFQSFIDQVIKLNSSSTVGTNIGSNLISSVTKIEDNPTTALTATINNNKSNYLKSEDEDYVCLKIPNGVIFDIYYIDIVMENFNKLMNSVTYMDWLNDELNRIEQNRTTNKATINYSKDLQNPLLLTYTNDHIELILTYVYVDDKWTMSLKILSEKADCGFLINKILKLKNPIMGFKSITQLMLLPPDIAKEVLSLINKEKEEQINGTSLEICLTVPEGLPNYLPRAGESAIFTDISNNRIGLLCNITYANPQDNNKKHTIYVPFLYNWENKIFCEWDANPEISVLRTNEECQTWLRNQRDVKYFINVY